MCQLVHDYACDSVSRASIAGSQSGPSPSNKCAEVADDFVSHGDTPIRGWSKFWGVHKTNVCEVNLLAFRGHSVPSAGRLFSLGHLVQRIYAKMDMLLFEDEDESSNSLLNSEDSKKSWKGIYEGDEWMETVETMI
ncbi:hypothetical protein GH714_028458 [Hevea brasiliensis]|uniref:Uncharacterized protein n=1 Tax=Hevea brasiliensis TaxID=3981 RepID=A0A6A6MEU3_HEVBR|nr:hypothetical protein GH714_028458 [Hevea brasiliensis]